MRLWTALMMLVAGLTGWAAMAETPTVGAPLPPLQGDVILTVAGLDPATFPGGELQLDQGRMAALGEAKMTTSTIWTTGPHEYTGLPLDRLMAYLGVSEGTLTARALNDYSIEVPVSDAVENGPMLAYLENGEPMPVRDKGPLWLIYPYDSNPDYRSEVIYTRSIWQLDRIEVSP